MLKISTISKAIAFVALCASVAHADITKSSIIYGNELAGKTQDLGTVNKTKKTYEMAVRDLLNQSRATMAQKNVYGAIPIPDHLYKFETASLEIGPAVRISLYETLRDTGACALPTAISPNEPGPCLVIEKGPKGAVQAYFVVSGKFDSNIENFAKGLTRIYRKDVKSALNVELTKRISALENGVTRIYSQRAEELVLTPEEKREEAEEAVIAQEPVIVIDPGAEKRDARARVRQAILNGTSIDRETLMKAITIETEVERSQAEKEFSRSSRRELKKIDLSNAEASGLATCYVAGKVSTPWVLGIRLDGLLGRVSTENKVGIFCYKDGLLRIRMNAVLKLKENAAGIRLPGTKAIAGAFGIGKIDGVIDLVTTKKADGTLLPYRQTPCVVGADVGFIFGAGVSAICVPSGREQRVTIGAQGRLQMTAGLTVQVLSISQLGLDPDDF